MGVSAPILYGWGETDRNVEKIEASETLVYRLVGPNLWKFSKKANKEIASINVQTGMKYGVTGRGISR